MQKMIQSRIVQVIKIVLIMVWLRILNSTDTINSCYLLLGLSSAGAICLNRRAPEPGRKEKWTLNALGALFSLSACLANYHILESPVRWGIALYAGYEVGANLIRALYAGMTGRENLSAVPPRRHPAYVFLAVFFCVLAVDLRQLFLFDYPGNLSPDSLAQIEQVLSGEYQDHHPYVHTLLVGLLIKPGLWLFHDLHAAVALYHVAQIAMMALCFAYAVMTLYQAGIRKVHLILPAAAYILLPYHIKYSVTMWKDVLFGAAMLLLAVSLYRLLREIGNRNINTAVLGVGLLSSMLLRSNGFLSLAAAFVFCLYFFIRKKQRRIILMFVVTLLLAWMIKGPVRDALGIQPANFRESLSIPIQQVARVIAREGELTQGQKELLSQVVDLELAKKEYLPYLSDPVKFSVDGEYIRAHKGEFLKAWIEIGLQNPVVYIEAWIEQTKGYWNGAYDYWVWLSYIHPNTLGLERRFDESIDPLSSYRLPRAIASLYGVGIHVWLLLCLVVFHLLRGDVEKCILGLPALLMVGTLLVATPVFCEFRYVYAVFTLLPFYAALSFGRTEGGAQTAVSHSSI